MCGIYGYIGKESAFSIILEGLRRLEYRGYDSWGLATIAQERFWKIKSTQYIPLKTEQIKSLPGNVGIGHTRWATHGLVSRRNAHPHFDCNGNIAVVHNGTLYNEASIRKELIARGHRLSSDTDTELFAHLLEESHEQDFVRAILESLRQVDGQYAFLILNIKEPNKMYAAKNGSPLKIGFGDNGIYISSDEVSFAGVVKQYVDLEDGDIARVSAEGTAIYGKDGLLVERVLEPVRVTPEQASKGDYQYFFPKEIEEAPEVIQNIVNKYVSDSEVKMDVDLPRLASKQKIVLTGAGSSYFASLIGEWYLRRIAGFLDVHPVISGELVSQYGGSGISRPFKNTLLIALTQSGETKDTLDALKFVRQNGATVLTLVNKYGTEAERHSDFVMRLHAAPEISVVATKTFVAEVLCLLILSLAFAQGKGKMAEVADILAALKKLPNDAQKILQNTEIRSIANKYHRARAFYPLSRGINIATALEAGRKLEEELHVHTIGTSLGTSAELKHGPLTMVTGKTLIFIAPSGQEHRKLLNNMNEAKARRAKIVAIATEGREGELVRNITEDIIWIPQCNELLTPILSSIALQLLTYYLGKEKGIRNFDRPRNLAKSVTVD